MTDTTATAADCPTTESIYAAAQRRADERAKVWETLSVNDAVTLDLVSHGDWSGIVRSIGVDGMTLTGKRGAVVHVIRNKANPGAMTAIIGAMPRGLAVRSIGKAA